MNKYNLSILKPTGKVLYKPLVLIIASIFGLLLLNKESSTPFDNYFLPSFGVGIYQAFLTLLFGNLVLRFAHKNILLKWIGIIFAPQPNKSLGLLFSSLCAFTWLLKDSQIVPLDALSIANIALSFLIGSAVSVLLYNLFGPKTRDFKVTYQIENDRQEAFVAVILSSVFLGTSFSFLPSDYLPNSGNGMVFFPLYLAIAGLIITFFGAIIVGEKPKNERYWLSISIVSAILMMIISTELIISNLPSHWSLNGVEFQPSDILLSVQIGLFAGLGAGISVKFYDLVANWYVSFVLKQSNKTVWVNLSLRFFINVIFPFLPVILISASLLISYGIGGIYGTSVSFLGMLSNVGLSLLITGNKLNETSLDEITTWQKQKMAMLSPNFRIVLQETFKSILGRKGQSA
ncbi:MAG: MFS family permease [Flammeovirgaceae bacterium]|jgi:MFS family permease